MFKLAVLLLFLLSCGFENEIDLNSNMFIGQEGVIGYSLDNIEISSDLIVDGSGFDPENVYIENTFTLSKPNPVIIKISGKYNDPLTASDIQKLALIGLENPSNESSKGRVLGLSKNPSFQESLTYNIKVSSVLAVDPQFNKILSISEPSYIYVGGDNHFDGEFMTPVPGENYYLFHEWATNQFSAYELLPEGNYRKVSLGTVIAPDNRFDELEFSTTVPAVNGYPVGYSIIRTGSRPVYKLTNDGSGIFGWSYTAMGVNLGLGSWFEVLPQTSNGEAVLFNMGRFGTFNNDSMIISEWDGVQWVNTAMGTALKSSVSGTWVDANTYQSRPTKAPDGSVWFALIEGSAPITGGDPLQLIDPINAYLVRVEYLGGAINNFSNWSARLYSFFPSQNTFISRMRDIAFSEFTNADNFTAYIAGMGVGKVVLSSGNVEYVPIARHDENLTSNYETNADFPMTRDSDGFQRVQMSVTVEKSLDNPSILIFQGYTAIFELDTRTDIITEILGKRDGATVEYSR